jgi:hypothetical protein
MKFYQTLALSALAGASPVTKVVELLSKMQAGVQADAEKEQQTYEEFADWCKSTAVEKQHSLKGSKEDATAFSATVEKSSATIVSSAAKIEEVTASLSTAEADLAKATAERKEQNAAYLKVDAELAQTIDALGRAHSIITRNPSLIQASAESFDAITEALSTIVDAQQVNLADKQQLASLLQDMQPQASVKNYENHSGGIAQVLDDMKEKAEDQRAATQKEEMESQHAFDMVKQSLENLMKSGNDELKKAKAAKSAAEEELAQAQGDLAAEQKDIKDTTNELATLQHDCMTRASEFEASQTESKEEMAALTKAKTIIQETTGGAASQAYGDAASFVQVKSSRKARVAKLLHEMGVAHPELNQMATRVESLLSVSTHGDVFGKVKTMIVNMVDKIQNEMEKDAEEHGFCVKETTESEAKRDAHQGTVDKLSARIDKSTALISKLKEESARLTQELAALAAQEAELTAIRQKEKSAFDVAEKDLSAGVEGVRMALGVLRDYYGQGEAASFVQTKDASGIIGMLEVAEADFSKGLADRRAEEDEAVAEFEKFTGDAKVTRASKGAEIKGKTHEAAELEKSVSDLSSDRSSTQEELDSVMKYLESLRKRCEIKAPTFEERQAKRNQEIEGLKNALSILEGESAGFLQIRRH